MKFLTFLLATNLYAAEVLIDQAWLNSRGPSPYYLDQPGTTYKLAVPEMATPGTAFAIIAKNITFDLQGNKILFNNSPRITFNGSFENTTGWTASPNSSRILGNMLKNELYDGQYSLKFEVPNPDQFVETTKTITLEPNTTYALSAMFMKRNKPATDMVMYVSLEGVTRREVNYSGGNNRGIQYEQEVFTTGNEPEVYKVRAGIRNSSLATNPVFIDHIQVTRTRVHGILVGASASGAASYSDVKRYGNADGAVVRAGSIRQGSDGASWATAVRNQSDASLAGLKTYVRGANSNSILWRSGKGTITKCGIHSDPKLIVSNRDQQYGSVLDIQYGLVEASYNTILDGPQMGINLPGTSASDIHHNNIRLKGRYTNGFGILATGPGTKVYKNTIDCTGNYACRGIMLGDGTPEALVKVYDNTVKFQYWANNQEYQGEPLGGGYGIQLESVRNAEVYGNDVTAFGNQVPTFALRVNNLAENVSVHDNIFRAVSGASHASAFKIGAIGVEDTISIKNNKAIVNEGIIGETNKTKLDIRNLFVKFENTITNPYYILETEYTGDPSPLHVEITLIDPLFFDQTSRDLLANAKWRKVHDRYKTGEDNRAALYVKWTTTITGQPGAPYEIVGHSSGVLDDSGKAVVELQEYKIVGGLKTITDSYDITMNQWTKTINANAPQTVAF